MWLIVRDPVRSQNSALAGPLPEPFKRYSFSTMEIWKRCTFRGATAALEIRAEEAEFGHGCDELRGEFAAAAEGFDDGEDLLVGELAGGLAR